MANYGLAGQYTSHYDQVEGHRSSVRQFHHVVQVLMGAGKNALQSREMFNMFAGDRMATVMGYLSDVPAGGYTVFPIIGAYVK